MHDDKIRSISCISSPIIAVIGLFYKIKSNSTVKINNIVYFTLNEVNSYASQGVFLQAKYVVGKDLTNSRIHTVSRLTVSRLTNRLTGF